jgi:hypothetical protein
MAVSKQDRDDYERGRSDEKAPFLNRAIDDITVNHPDSPAYYKGREGEPLDADKKSK